MNSARAFVAPPPKTLLSTVLSLKDLSCRKAEIRAGFRGRAVGKMKSWWDHGDSDRKRLTRRDVERLIWDHSIPQHHHIPADWHSVSRRGVTAGHIPSVLRSGTIYHGVTAR
jgi:hypothetical protein